MNFKKITSVEEKDNKYRFCIVDKSNPEVYKYISVYDNRDEAQFQLSIINLKPENFFIQAIPYNVKL